MKLLHPDELILGPRVRRINLQKNVDSEIAHVFTVTQKTCIHPVQLKGALDGIVQQEKKNVNRYSLERGPFG